jgi:hypothetical protein
VQLAPRAVAPRSEFSVASFDSTDHLDQFTTPQVLR